LPLSAADELADVGVARGDGAVERRGDAVEIFQFLQPVDIGLGGFDVRLFQFRSRPVFSAVSCSLTLAVLSKSVQRSAVILARSRLALRLVQFGLGLRELLVQFRRVNFREHLAVGDVIADVHQPVFQIAAGARVDRSLDERLHFRRQRRAQIRLGGVGETTSTVMTESACVSRTSSGAAIQRGTRPTSRPMMTSTMTICAIAAQTDRRPAGVRVQDGWSSWVHGLGKHGWVIW
jgi:hypothetical protein